MIQNLNQKDSTIFLANNYIGEFSNKINTKEIPLVFKITLDEITRKIRNR